MYSYKEADCIAAITSPAFDNISEQSTTIDSAVSHFSLDDAKGTDSSTQHEHVQQPPLVGFRCFTGGSMQVECISACSSALKSPPSMIFLDWDDGLFPTTELFDRWRVPKDKSLRRGFSYPSCRLSFSSAQRSLLDSWQDAVCQYVATCCKLSQCCVILTTSERAWVQECIESFAPDLRTLFDSPDGPRVVYGCDAGPAGHAEYKSWKMHVVRSEAKDFYAKRQGLSPGAAYDLDAIDEVSFHCGGSPASVRSISQMTMRMLLDSQKIQAARSTDIPSLDIPSVASDTISGPLQSGAFDEALARLQRPDSCQTRIRSYNRTKPVYMDFSHRQELHEQPACAESYNLAAIAPERLWADS